LDIDQQGVARAKARQSTAGSAFQKSSGLSFDMYLYDSYGNLLRKATTSGNNVQFDVAALPNGIYYLHIDNGISAKPEKRQIIVQH
jgi:hypothetical protein